MTPDEALMRRIKQQWGDLIEKTCASSSVFPAFLAALIANESGGNPKATRFEPAVNARLQAKRPDWDPQRVRDNATSWGLTQIMGENYPGPPPQLADPEVNLKHACYMIADFARHFWLDVTKDFADLFRCWNTGNPHGKTYDPAYVENGLARMQLWIGLDEAAKPAVTL